MDCSDGTGGSEGVGGVGPGCMPSRRSCGVDGEACGPKDQFLFGSWSSKLVLEVGPRVHARRSGGRPPGSRQAEAFVGHAFDRNAAPPVVRERARAHGVARDALKHAEEHGKSLFLRGRPAVYAVSWDEEG